jgi:hypothetical protein
MKKLFTFLFLCSLIAKIFAQGSWTQKTDFGGAVRDGSVGFSIGNKGYIGTGIDNSSNFFYKDLWEYSPVSNSWTQKADYGGGLIAFAVGFSIGNMGYIGTGINGSGYTKEFWEYNPISNIWSKKSDFNFTRMEAVGFSIGNTGFIGTGVNGNGTFQKDFWAYNSATDNWTQKSDFGGTPRCFSTGFSIAGKGYIGTGDDGTFKDDFWEYDTLTNTWAQKANFGGGSRRAATGFSIGSNGYIGTGEPALNDFWKYNSLNDTWIQVASFGGAGREFAVSFSIDNKGYVGTGLSSIPSLKDFWEYYPCSITPSICMVTVDSTSQNNVIIWDRSAYSHVDSFIVCREVGLNNYQRIAAIPYDSLSLFVDTVRSKYFPNTGNPNAGTYKYKLQVRDSCGGLSQLSQDHNTIFIINNGGTFSWPQLYLIGGTTNPVNNYVLMRDNLSNGNWTVVNSVTGSQQTVTDPQYSTYQATASWRVETQWGISCNPTRTIAQAQNFNASRSNIFSFANGVNEYYNNPSISISPNPFTESAILNIANGNTANYELKILDIYGKEVMHHFIPKGENNFAIERSGLASGMYFYKLINGNKIIATGKLMIE